MSFCCWLDWIQSVWLKLVGVRVRATHSTNRKNWLNWSFRSPSMLFSLFFLVFLLNRSENKLKSFWFLLLISQGWLCVLVCVCVLYKRKSYSNWLHYRFDRSLLGLICIDNQNIGVDCSAMRPFFCLLPLFPPLIGYVRHWCKRLNKQEKNCIELNCASLLRLNLIRLGLMICTNSHQVSRISIDSDNCFFFLSFILKASFRIFILYWFTSNLRHA